MVSQAGQMLKFKPADAAALDFQSQAQRQLRLAALDQEKKYQVALEAAQSALSGGNLEVAIAQAQAALGVKPGDTAANTVLQQAGQAKAAAAPHVAAGPLSSSAAKAPPPFTNSIGMEFVWVPGVPPGGAYVGRYEVTQKQFRALDAAPVLDQPAEGDNLPVANVSFDRAKAFCDSLSKREGKHYTLPSKSDWLGAAGLTADQVPGAWNLLKSGGVLQAEVTSLETEFKQPVAVGSRGPQTNGLCDLFGNVREWVIDDAGAERAGFSFQSTGGGQTKKLFLPAKVAVEDTWIARETGFRCIMRETN